MDNAGGSQTQRWAIPQKIYRNGMTVTVAISFALMATLAAIVVISSLFIVPPKAEGNVHPTAVPTATPKPFDPSVNAPLPNNRIVAFYGIPGAEVAGPAFETSPQMLTDLAKQAQAYLTLDPTHPVMPGIDLVVHVPDQCSSDPADLCSHWIDPSVIQEYIDFCQKNNLLLFLDLNFGRAPIQPTVQQALPYLEKYSFVHLAIDPEWAVGPTGYPGYDVGQMHAADINWIIDQMAAIPMKDHLPRKVLIIHEFRPLVLPDKSAIVVNPDVSIVLHVDSVGNYNGAVNDKIEQYTEWVQQDKLAQNQPVPYGGFKLFYWLEGPFHLMTPDEVMQLSPPPLVITYGN